MSESQVTYQILLETFHPLLPWVCLGLLFYIPGVYLEFPADPWQHYGRINEWSWLQTVTEHSAWNKSSYFLGYSLIGRVSQATLQLKWFDFYYTGCCLLLCWQYYRLARATGLSERATTTFVILQALLFGNNLFGFYRYYGMSSTVFAQLGAIALTRIVLEAAKHPQFSLRWFFGLHPFGGSASSGEPRQTFYRLLPAVALLLALTAFNHVQGLAIAGLGLAAVAAWRLVEWRRAMLGWFALLALALSVAAVSWLPKHALLEEVYRPMGWLTSWYGFDIFSPTSPAFDRTAAILGIFGLLNLLAGLALLVRNHLAGWLTSLPILFLTLPCVTIPFANMLASDPALGEQGNILIFHRMLFAIPAGLALATLLDHSARKIKGGNIGGPGYLILLVVLPALVLTSSARPYYNRLYNALMVTANDLSMRPLIHAPFVALMEKSRPESQSAQNPEQKFVDHGSILTTPGIGYVLNATGVGLFANPRKSMLGPAASSPAQSASVALENLQQVDSRHARRSAIEPLPLLFSATSFSGFLSGHWLPSEVALALATQRELDLFPTHPAPTLHRQPPQIWLEWTDPTGRSQTTSQGVGLPLAAPTVDDRGSIIDGAKILVLKVGDLITLRPYMRTPNGDGWRLTLVLQGPGTAMRWDCNGTPSPLGGIGYVTNKVQVRLPVAGRYSLELRGTTLWPRRDRSVLYHLDVESE